MTNVTNAKNDTISFKAAVELMDDEILEDMSSSFEPGFDNAHAFFVEYARRHEAKFNEAFAPFVGAAW